MTVWSHLPTILKRRQVLRIAGILTLCVAFITTLFFSIPTHAAQNVTQAISFQGRLLNPSGGYVADGYYNIQFKVYQDTTPVWTESYVNNNANAGVQVKNGYFSVRLGSHTAFGTNVDWSRDDLSLSMNVGGSAAACTTFGTSPCVADGEMTPRTHLDAVPFAINAGNANNLGGISASGFIQNTTTVQTGDFNISGTGKASSLQGSTSVMAPLFDRADTGALDIGTVSASSINIGGANTASINLAQNVSVAAGKSLTLAGGNTASRPSSPTEGTLYYDTTTHKLQTWNGSKWVSDSSTATKIVAANDSPQTMKDAADYVADGTADDVEINAALTAAAGGKVYVAEGTYYGLDTITVPANTTLAGAGRGTLIYLTEQDDTNENLIETGANSVVQDLRLNGQKSVQGGTISQNGIYTLGGSGDGNSAVQGARVQNVWVENFATNGVYLNTPNNTVTNSTLQNNSNGVYMQSAPRNTISDNMFYGNNGRAIWALWLYDRGDTIIANNSIQCTDGGNDGYGIDIAASSDMTITDNTIKDCFYYGMQISGWSSRNTVTGNAISGTGVAGIRIDTGSNNLVSANTIHSIGGPTTNNAIQIIYNSDNNSVTGNNITDTACSTDCYAINIMSASADTNSLSANALGAGATINDAGTSTIYANQLDASGKLINKSAGGVQVQSSTNNASALDVQNAAGASALKVDTTTNSVLVAGALDTTAAAGMTIGSTNATSITIGKSSSNIATTVLGTAIFKPTTGNDSTTAFQIQRADGTKMFVADSTNQTITFGNSATGNYTVISSSTGAITKYGTARNTRAITLNAEYTGSVLDPGTGSNNTGVMTSSVDLTNRMNYYKWTTSQGTNQSYDVVVQIPLPSDFDGWASSNPLAISTYTSNTSNGTITLEARDSSNAVQCNFVSVTPGSTGTWATNNSACTLSSGTYTAGDQMTLRIRMQSPSGGDVRVGNINLSYLSKY